MKIRFCFSGKLRTYSWSMYNHDSRFSFAWKCITWIFHYKQIAYLWAYNLAKWLKSITLFEASFIVVLPFSSSTEELSFEVICITCGIPYHPILLPLEKLEGQDMERNHLTPNTLNHHMKRNCFPYCKKTSPAY